MDNYQYHLTFNGRFTNETYIEYFNPNYLDKKFENEKAKPSSDINCTEALKHLKEALDGNEVSDEKCEQTFRKLHDMFCDDQCNKDCNSYKSQKESENLYFREEYQKSITIIKKIISDWPFASEKADLCHRMKCQWDNLPNNNRILFHGQRGSGKTSVTMSVAKSLEGHGIGYATFKVLPIINPCYFDDDTNILKTIISNMFEMAKCIIKKEENDNQRNNHEDLLKQFEEVYRLLGCIESPNKEKHTLETLNEISKASGMREAMQELVNKFIKILPCKAKYLVLVIDDVDMSVAYAATMLEQINKFLELDNLLILISANLDQLHNEMREHYSKAFEKTLRDENQSLSIDVEDLASKYLLKLFPASHRINVERPISKLLQTELIINDRTGDDLQKVVLSLIWEKTRLLYIPKDAENTLHPVIPTNLRELTQLINLLQGMEKVEIGHDEDKQPLFADMKSYKICQRNINTFKNYFLNIWVPTHLSVDEEQVFINIPSDITEINKHLINSINVIGTKNKKRLMSREVGLDMIVRNAEDVNIDRDIYTMVSPNDPRFVKANKISDIFNQPSNYSYGDLLLMIDKYETYFESEEDRRFTNAIKIYYSFLLFETMFFKSRGVEYYYIEWIKNELIRGRETNYKKLYTFIKNKQNKKNSIDSVICKLLDKEIELGEDGDEKNEMDKLNKNWIENEKQPIPIQKLIGGTVYYPNYFEIITSDYFKQKGPSFDAKRAFYHKVETDNKINVGKDYPLFSVLYYGDIRPDRSETKHIYDTTYDNNAEVDGLKYVTFDMLSILSNMLNPWHTINRIYDVYHYNEWKTKIKEWGLYCSIDNNVTTPNTILPFYSVDIMLLFLKNQFNDVAIIQKGALLDYSVFKENKRIIDKVRDILYDCNIILETNGKEGLKIGVNYDQETTNATYKIDALIKRETKKTNNKKDELASRNIYNMIIDVVKKNGFSTKIIVDDGPIPIFTINGGKWNLQSLSKKWLGAVIKNIQNVLFPLMECYRILICKCPENGENPFSEKISLPDRFRDHCIAVILSEYKGEKKDRDALIKGLKKYNYISEMYKYLVDQLWENAATEALIRMQIQRGIRYKKTVECYYFELLLLLYKSYFIDGIQWAVYKNIYFKACKLFITDSSINPS